jgi:hypothetical protein
MIVCDHFALLLHECPTECHPVGDQPDDPQEWMDGDQCADQGGEQADWIRNRITTIPALPCSESAMAE